MKKSAIWFVLSLMFGVGGGVRCRALDFFSKQLSVEVIQKELAKMPEDLTSRKKARLLSDLGTLFYKQNQPHQAVQVFEQALSQPCGGHLRLHIYRTMAKCYDSLGRLDKAVESLEKAVAQDPKNWKRYRDLAGMYARVDLNDKAAGSYEKALQLNKKDSGLYFNLARVYFRLDLYEKAESFLEKAKFHGRQGPEWDRDMSIVLEAQGRFHEALVLAKHTMSEKAPLDDKARILYLSLMAGNMESAQKAFAEIKVLPASKESLLFYEEVLKSFTENPTKVLEVPFRDPTLKALVLKQ